MMHADFGRLQVINPCSSQIECQVLHCPFIRHEFFSAYEKITRLAAQVERLAPPPKRF